MGYVLAAVGPELVEGALIFVAGTAIGSFVNVVILRTRAKTSVADGRSKCMGCQLSLSPRDLVPVVSFLALRGKCRSCKVPISIQYPLVELSAGLLFVLAFLNDGLGLAFVRDAAFLSVLLVIFVYDLRYMEIPDRFTIPAMAFALVANLYLGFAWTSLALGAVVAGGFFLAQYVLSKGAWIGGGDIRLGALMGLMLGLPSTVAALFVAYVVGAIYAGWLIATKKGSANTQVPFGTFLSFATVVSMFWGDGIVGWYLGLIG